MSANSELSLQKFIHDQGIRLMALQETGSWEPTKEFFKEKTIMKNNITGKDHLRGVALIVQKDLTPELVDIEDTNIDAIWCQIKLGRRRILVSWWDQYTYLPVQEVKHLKTCCYTLKQQNLTKKAKNSTQ